MTDTKIETNTTVNEVLMAYLKDQVTQKGGVFDEEAAKKDLYGEIQKHLGLSKEVADNYAKSVIDNQQALNTGKEGGVFNNNEAPQEEKEKGKEDDKVKGNDGEQKVGGVVTNDPEDLKGLEKVAYATSISLNPEDLKLWIDAHAIEGSLATPPYASMFARLDNATWDDKHKIATMKFTNSDNHLNMAPGVVQYAASKNNESKVPSEEEAMAMVLAGMQQGWSFVELKGSPEFKEAMYVACQKLGMETRGYVPTPNALAKAAEGCKALSEEDAKGKCYYEYIGDMAERFPKIKEFAKGHNATEKMVSDYSQEGLGAFGTKYRTTNLDDGIDHTLSPKEQKKMRKLEDKEAKRRLDDDKKYFKKSSKDMFTVVFQPGVVVTKETKTVTEENKEDNKTVDNKSEDKKDKKDKESVRVSLQERIKKPYDKDHDEVEKELIRVSEMEKQNISDVEKTFSNQTKGTWNSLHKKTDLTPEDKKALEAEKKFLAYCQTNKLDPQKINVPEKYMPENIKKDFANKRHDIELTTAMICNCAMMTLASRKKDYMEGKTPEKTIGAQMCEDYQAFYKSVEEKSFADKLQASQKVKSNAKEIDTKVNSAYQQQTGESLKWATVYKDAQAKTASNKAEGLAKTVNVSAAQVAQKRNQNTL